jgi:hypothetical protein
MGMSTSIPFDLPAEWRKRADTLREYGDPNVARVWDLAATELAKALATHGEETLSLVEAARVSGYTADHLGLLVKKGTIPNANPQGSPRIRRADLPVKSPGGPGRKPQPKSVSAVDKIDVRGVHKLRRSK